MGYIKKGPTKTPGHVTSQRSRQAAVSTAQGQGHFGLYGSRRINYSNSVYKSVDFS